MTVNKNYINEAICGDCLNILKKISENSIDLIVTSPPYADQRKNTYGFCLYLNNF